MKIYTDGAVSHNGFEDAVGGWAFLALDDFNNELYRASAHVDPATNNICELLAVLNGCQYGLEHYNGFEIITIYSDSAYIIDCCNDNWYKKWQLNGWLTSKKQPVLNQDLWKALIPYFDNPIFSFKKVKGHSTNEYNNIVDKMAVEAKQLNG